MMYTPHTHIVVVYLGVFLLTRDTLHVTYYHVI